MIRVITLALIMKAAGISEKSVYFHETTQLCTPQSSHLLYIRSPWFMKVHCEIKKTEKKKGFKNILKQGKGLN
jgi:hypothetical protein